MENEIRKSLGSDPYIRTLNDLESVNLNYDGILTLLEK
jgi:hypothetical protein